MIKNIFNRLIKICLYSLVFLLPIFWLPFTFEGYDFSKQYLLFFLVSISLFCWLAKMAFVEKEIRFRRTPLDLPILAFLAIGILSFVFSIDKTSSVFGSYGRFSGGIVGFLSLGLLYFLLTNNLRVQKDGEPRVETEPEFDTGRACVISVEGIIKTLLCSVGVAVLMTYFSLFGVWLKINNVLSSVHEGFSLPTAIFQRNFNPVAASLEGIAVFLAVLAVFLVALILLEKRKSRLFLFFKYLLLAATLFLLLLINFAAVWFVLLLSLAFFVGLSLSLRIFKEDVNKLLLPIFLLLFAVFSLATNISSIVIDKLPSADKTPLPREIILNQNYSFQISLSSLKANLKNTILGSGPGTWYYDFLKFRPVGFNQSQFWQIRFDRPASHISEIIGTMGLLGLVSHLTILGLVILISLLLIQALARESRLLDSKQLPLFIFFISLLAAQFFYYQNIVLSFAFWLVLGLLAVSWGKPLKEKIFSFKDLPELSLFFNVILISFGIVLAVFYIFAFRFYLADLNYVEALSSQDIKEGIRLLEKAIELNPEQPQYKIILARIYFNQAVIEAAKPPENIDGNILSENVSKALSYINGGIVNGKMVKGATQISPEQVFGWEVLGTFYRDMGTLVQGSAEWGIKSFSRAIELDPTNPVLHTELGKLYLIQNEKDKAKEEFAKAGKLKPDYPDVQIQLALIYEQENNLPDAIKIFEGLAGTYSFNADILFQLGRLYYNNGQINEAAPVLKRATDLSPNFSNAHYILGLIYQKQNQNALAIFEFERVLALNPDNTDVLGKLKELKGEK